MAVSSDIGKLKCLWRDAGKELFWRDANEH